ncbi:hypothetical protein [Methylobacterium durans]|uniref:Uncharacterized protein n=1 Tax=Methylobacterium durans TaxID=2202825 RepID=A0A2U8W8B1_9HYPH|nr:hypothetical protein [Methylobacterium durans]AWN41871.1 hypothetical protein DK389_16910 [Methylobacterium durans]
MQQLAQPIEAVRHVADGSRAWAVLEAEAAVDAYVSDFPEPGDKVIALDILLRDLARLRLRAPEFDAFLDAVEGHIDDLHRDLARRAA